MTLRKGAAGSRAGCRPSELSMVRHNGRVDLLTAEISEGVGLGTWRHADFDPRGELSVLRKNPYLLVAGADPVVPPHFGKKRLHADATFGIGRRERAIAGAADTESRV